MMDVQTIQALYPHPISERDTTGGSQEYCVGGAVCLAHQASLTVHIDDWGFPVEYELAPALAEINPDLEDPEEELENTLAWRLACAILDANDEDRDFARAWQLVREAFAYRKPSHVAGKEPHVDA
jgi:hypothetical protein